MDNDEFLESLCKQRDKDGIVMLNYGINNKSYNPDFRQADWDRALKIIKTGGSGGRIFYRHDKAMVIKRGSWNDGPNSYVPTIEIHTLE